MTIAVLRPVGEPVDLSALMNKPPQIEWPPGYSPLFVNSGTAALALALQLAEGTRHRPGGEVIIPGYGCPDLVSAVVYAGFAVTCVDTLSDSPFMDTEALAEAVGPNTIAVVAAHFFGMREDIGNVRSRMGDVPAPLIEDSAQALPSTAATVRGDFITHSFGRGKPGGALGGGVLLAPAGVASKLEEFAPTSPELPSLSRSTRAALTLHRVLLQDLPYGLVSRIGMFGVGSTRYRHLLEIRPLSMQKRIVGLAGTQKALESDRRSHQAELLERLHEVSQRRATFKVMDGVTDLTPLARFPIVMATPAVRDRALIEFRKHGMGATAMYPRAIVEMPDLPIRPAGNTPRACQLCRTLLALPVHSGVEARHVTLACQILERL